MHLPSTVSKPCARPHHLHGQEASNERLEQTNERVLFADLYVGRGFGRLVGDVPHVLLGLVEEDERLEHRLHLVGGEVEIDAAVALDDGFALEDRVTVVVQRHTRDGHLDQTTGVYLHLCWTSYW